MLVHPRGRRLPEAKRPGRRSRPRVIMSFWCRGASALAPGRGGSMTEQEWLSWEGETRPMVDLVCARGANRTNAGKRKLRLFALACAGQWEHLLEDDPAVRGLLGLIERHADGAATTEELGEGSLVPYDLGRSRGHLAVQSILRCGCMRNAA